MLLAGFVLFLSAQASADFSDGPEGFQKVYGPEKVYAGFPKRRAHMIHFETDRPEEQFFIRIVNGNGEPALKEDCKKKKGWDRAKCEIKNALHHFGNELFNVDKVSLEVNGKKILKNQNFKKIQTYLDVPVQFKKKNKLELELKGSVISYIQVLIFQSGQENQMPIASFMFSPKGDDEPRSILFDASASSDSDGSITSYVWRSENEEIGEGVQIEHTFDEYKEYSVQLVVTDDRGATAQSTQVVSVFDEVAPVLAVTQPLDGAVIEGENVEISGTSNEALASAQVNGQVLVLSEDKKSFSGRLILPEGSHALSFVAEDLAGNQTTQAVSISVNINLPPVAEFGFVFPDSTNPGLVSVGNQASDPDGSVVEIIYEWGDGSSTSSLDEVVPHSYAQEGSYQLTQRVLDNEGGISATTKTVVVSFSNQFPKAILTADRYSGPVGVTVNFDSALSFDPEGSPISHYQWRVHKPDGTIQIFNGQPKLSYSFSEAAVYRVRLRVLDDKNAAQFDEAYVSIGEVNAPEPVILAKPHVGRAPLTVSFDGTNSSAFAESAIHSYIWNFADGGRAQGKIVSHTFQKVGDYPVKLTVLTEEGEATSSIIISAYEIEPQIAIDLKITQNGQGNRTVSFSAEAKPMSEDVPWPPQNLTYSWQFGDQTNGSGQAIVHTYASDGPFLVKLEVTDDLGRKGYASRVIQDVSIAPVVSDLSFLLFGSEGLAPLTVQADVNSLDSVISKYRNFVWDFGGEALIAGENGLHTFVNEGSFEVRLKAQTNSGFDVISLPQTVLVSGQRPNIKAVLEATTNTKKYLEGDLITVLRVPQTINLSAIKSTSLNGPITDYTWTTPAGTLKGQEVVYTVAQHGEHRISLTVKDSQGEQASSEISVNADAGFCVASEDDEEGDDICLDVAGTQRRDVLDFSHESWTITTGLSPLLQAKSAQDEIFEGLPTQSWISLTVDEESLFYNLSSAAEVVGSNIVISKSGLQTLGLPFEKTFDLEIFVVDENDDVHTGKILGLRFGLGTFEFLGATEEKLLDVKNAEAGFYRQVTVLPGQQNRITGLPLGHYLISSPTDPSFSRAVEVTVASQNIFVDLDPQPVQAPFLAKLSDSENLVEDPKAQEMTLDVPMMSLSTSDLPFFDTGDMTFPFRGCRGGPVIDIPRIGNKQWREENWALSEIKFWDALASDQKGEFRTKYDGEFNAVDPRRITYEGGEAILRVRCVWPGSPLQPVIDAHNALKFRCCKSYREEFPEIYQACLAKHDADRAQRIQNLSINGQSTQVQVTLRDALDHEKPPRVFTFSGSYASTLSQQHGSADTLLRKGFVTDGTIRPGFFRVFSDYTITIPKDFKQVEMKAVALQAPDNPNEQSRTLCLIGQERGKKPKLLEVTHLKKEEQSSGSINLGKQSSGLRFFNEETRLFPFDTEFKSNLPEVEPVLPETADPFKVNMKVVISPKNFLPPRNFGVKLRVGDTELEAPTFDFEKITSGPDVGSADSDAYRVTLDFRDYANYEWAPNTSFLQGVAFNFNAIWALPDNRLLRGGNRYMKWIPASYNWQHVDEGLGANGICRNGSYGTVYGGWARSSFLQMLYDIVQANPDIGFRCNDGSHPFGGKLSPHSSHNKGGALDVRYFNTNNSPDSMQDAYDSWVQNLQGNCDGTQMALFENGKSKDTRAVMSHTKQLLNRYFDSALQPKTVAHEEISSYCFPGFPVVDACNDLGSNDGGETYTFESIQKFCYNIAQDDLLAMLELCGNSPVQEAKRLADYVILNRQNIEKIVDAFSVENVLFISPGEAREKNFVNGTPITRPVCLPTSWHADLLYRGRIPQIKGVSRKINLLNYVKDGNSAERFIDAVGFWDNIPWQIKPEKGHSNHFHIGRKK